MACTAEIVAACADRLVVRNGSLTRRLLRGEKMAKLISMQTLTFTGLAYDVLRNRDVNRKQRR